MSYEQRSTTMEFSVASSSSLWQSHRIRKHLPIVLSVAFSALIAVAAILLKFTALFPVTYRVVECKEILPYQAPGADVSWPDIEDEYFTASVIGFSILCVILTELASIAYSESVDYNEALTVLARKCGNVLGSLLNGLFSVMITTSVIQRTSGTMKPFFLTICPAACAWPATSIRSKNVDEDLEFCFNTTATTGNSNQDHLKTLLIDARMSFPSFQEAVFAFAIVFLSCYWHSKRITRVLRGWDALRLVTFTTMIIFLVMMSHSKMIRHKTWLSDVCSGIGIGIVIAIHQSIEWHVSPLSEFGDWVDTQSRPMSRDPEVAELKHVNIPRVTYRRSLAERRRQHFSRSDLHIETGNTNPSFMFTSKQ